MKSLEKILMEAKESGEVLNIKYNGGSQPGSIRELSPISVSGDNVKARCLASNRVKTFKLSKMEIRKVLKPIDYIEGHKKAEPESLKEALSPHEKCLRDLGFALSIGNKYAEVYRTFKNGKSDKTPDVFIRYRRCVDGWEATRPWYINSNITGQASSFKKLSTAIEKFLNLAKEAKEY